PVMARLARAGISMHAQIVLCPGLNDGARLARTVFDLSALHPGVRTTAIVPVGLTRHRQRLPELRSLEPNEARALAATVTAWQDELRARLGSRFVFLADEVYLLAGLDVPPGRAYEGFPVIEDGIGLVRRFEDGFRRARADPRRDPPGAGRRLPGRPDARGPGARPRRPGPGGRANAGGAAEGAGRRMRRAGAASGTRSRRPASSESVRPPEAVGAGA